MDLTEADRAELTAQAQRIVATNRYLTLSTADSSGRPWVTPVYFTPDGDHRFLWLSSPTARHSRNIAERSEVAFTIFDSTVPIGRGEAVYCSAGAGLVAVPDLERSAVVFAARYPELASFTAEDMTGESPLRLYEARVVERSVLLRGGDPRNLGEVDTRVAL